MDTHTLVQRLKWFDSTVVSDALDGLGLPPGIGDLKPQWGAPKLAGVARTIELEPDTGGPPGPHLATRTIAGGNKDDVIVVANHGRTDVSSWGGILSLGASIRGIAGVVTDGVCRDVAEAEAYQFPVYARGVIPRTARARLREKSTGGSVTIAGLKVNDGDLVLADSSGFVVIPRHVAQEVLDSAEAVTERESKIISEVLDGRSLPEAMHDARLAGHQSSETSGTASNLSVVEQLGLLPTAAISDALDRLELPGSVLGLAGLREDQSACGPAFTVTYEPVDEAGGTVGDFLDDVPAGAVVFIDNAGRTDCTVWGGIMTRLASAAGIAATVINGVCRDTEHAASLGYPIWSAGRFMRTGKDRVRVRAVQQPLTIDGVCIRPGDVVRADVDGVVVVPIDRADEIATLARAIEDAEDRIVSRVRHGATLAEARAAEGYHSLQKSAGG